MTNEQLEKARELSYKISNITSLLEGINNIIDKKPLDWWNEGLRINFGFSHIGVDKELAEYLKPYFEAKLNKYKKELEEL